MWKKNPPPTVFPLTHCVAVYLKDATFVVDAVVCRNSTALIDCTLLVSATFPFVAVPAVVGVDAAMVVIDVVPLFASHRVDCPSPTYVCNNWFTSSEDLNDAIILLAIFWP